MADFQSWDRNTLNRFAAESSRALLERNERIQKLESAMRRMHRAVINPCSGESQFAMGVNAACDQHAVGLEEIMAEHGVSYELEGVCTSCCGNEPARGG